MTSNQLISAVLKPVMGHTEKPHIVLQTFTTNKKIEIILVWLAIESNETGIIRNIFLFYKLINIASIFSTIVNFKG